MFPATLVALTTACGAVVRSVMGTKVKVAAPVVWLSPLIA